MCMQTVVSNRFHFMEMVSIVDGQPMITVRSRKALPVQYLD